jgi:hypothetical protein
MDGNPIAIPVGLRRTNDWTQRNVVQLSNSLQNIAHLSPFDGQLMIIRNVLIGAAAAFSEIGTRRDDPIRRWLQDFDDFGFGEAFLFSHNFRDDLFAVDGERNENRLSIFACDAFAAESDVMDFEFD